MRDLISKLGILISDLKKASLKNILFYFLLGFAAGSGCDGNIEEDVSPTQKEFTEVNEAMDYIISRLQERGYTQIQRGNLNDSISQLFINPDNGNGVANIYEIHAVNPTTGDEQWWELDQANLLNLIELRDAREAQGLTPDIVLTENGYNDTNYLDSLIDKYCNN